LHNRGVKAVIGTHFYQTDPDVIDDFIGSKNVKFILNPKGVFHPKCYLFGDEDKWEAIIGSGNFTRGALEVNDELNILLSNNDGDHFERLSHIFDSYFTNAESVDEKGAKRYRNIWEDKKKKLARFAGEYENTKPSLYSTKSVVMSMDWNDFLKEIKKDKLHGFKERLMLLDQFRDIFISSPDFKSMEPMVRRAIAGAPHNKIEIKNYKWFGSMKGSGHFTSAIINAPEGISDALEHIPLTGLVTKEQYDAFVDKFEKAVAGNKMRIASASRLLAMKRPDQFFCLDSANLDNFAIDVGMTYKKDLDYERYWNEVVLRIMDSPWWQSPRPISGEARRVWNARAAMLDSIFFGKK
jgi:hypothetical protein